MDRNIFGKRFLVTAIGRTPQECVDRNIFGKRFLVTAIGRTPQECVDRNITSITGASSGTPSHSTGVRG